jgi:hypothetical protein
MPISPCIKPSTREGGDTSYVKRPEDPIRIAFTDSNQSIPQYSEVPPNIEAKQISPFFSVVLSC